MLGCFSRVPADGSFLQFLNFEIQDPRLWLIASRPLRENLRSKKLVIHFLWAASFLSATQAKNFLVFGCGWWCDREIVLLPHPTPVADKERQSH